MTLSRFSNSKQPLVFSNRITVGHACDVVGNGAVSVLAVFLLIFGGQQTDICAEGLEQLLDRMPRFVAHARHLIVLIQVVTQEFFQFLLFLPDFLAEIPRAVSLR
mgnify:CR=1 FL=1